MDCKNCKEPMRLDDTDFNFKGNYDKYYVCDHCNCSCIEETRYSKVTNVIWNMDECEINK